MTEENTVATEECFLTRKELAALLQVRPERIRKWERRGLIPRLAPAGTRLVLYPRSAVLAWLARVRTNEDRKIVVPDTTSGRSK
jgi:excisionase family DNA binding protein